VSQRIQLLEDLGAEFRRVASEQSNPRASASPSRHRAVAIAAVIVLLAAGAYSVPVTRAAIDDLSGTFTAWVAGGDENPPGRALRPEDDAPDWIRAHGGRVIAEAEGVRLYVTRRDTSGDDPVLDFALGNGTGIGDTVSGWRKRFDDHAVVVLGPTPFGGGHLLDPQGRVALLGVTARSVRRLELRYAEGPVLVSTAVDGGFVMMADARRPPRELIAYDSSGSVLERADVRYLDMRYWCLREAARCN
jgi:hypothetical protein